MEQKTLVTQVAVCMVALLVGVLFGVALVKNNTLGTQLTQNTATQSYTDGSDLYQNVQAMSERMAGLTEGQLLQADSQGRMQAVSSLKDVTFNGATISQSVSSTVTVGNTADGVGTGCIVIGDSAGATSTPVYLTATGSTLTATTTAPAICR